MLSDQALHAVGIAAPYYRSTRFDCQNSRKSLPTARRNNGFAQIATFSLQCCPSAVNGLSFLGSREPPTGVHTLDGRWPRVPVNTTPIHPRQHKYGKTQLLIREAQARHGKEGQEGREAEAQEGECRKSRRVLER